VAVGLLFDLGRPWNIWRPMFFWQHHSVLFEVAWCVMLYTTVLALEFAPVPLETSRFHRLHRLLKGATIPLVILGIMLSTLHQSSLGSLFLLTPSRVHPLWYSPILPVLFFISAVGLGLGMVMVESRTTAWLYGRQPEDSLLTRLATPFAFVLILYVIVRVVDLGIRHQLSSGNLLSPEGALFFLELAISSIVPAVLVLGGWARRSGKVLGIAAFLTVVGFVLHRLDVGGVSGIRLTASGYVPSLAEIATSLGVVSAAILAFFFFVEHFRVYAPEEEPAREARPEISPARLPLATVRSSSALFVFGAAVAFALLPDGALGSPVPDATPVSEARRVLGVKVERANPKGPTLVLAAPGTEGAHEVLLIDGDRANEVALFDHAEHERRLGPDACATCHHMNRPNDRETSCCECHRDEHLPTDIFDHERHVAATDGNHGCSGCHPDRNAPKDRAHTTPCLDCHRDMVAGSDRIPAPGTDSRFFAPGYEEAMHGVCRKCHEEEDRKNAAKVPTLSLCSTCHPERTDLRPRPAGED
jgi:Ni/Fe-hydrogenase subunit HybB-like protein